MFKNGKRIRIAKELTLPQRVRREIHRGTQLLIFTISEGKNIVAGVIMHFASNLFLICDCKNRLLINFNVVHFNNGINRILKTF